MNTPDNNMSTNNMSTDGNNEPTLSKCANCGKEGSNLNSCNKCKMVTYCNAACKKKHRSKHKKKCDRRIAEIHDEALFKQPPQRDECPICFLQIPTLETGSKYYSCCGKTICSGCIYAPVYDNNGNKIKKKCPFCRTPTPSSLEDAIDLLKNRVNMGDAIAMYCLGCLRNIDRGFPQNTDKALELWHRAGELGCTKAYHNIGNAYINGRGVERDEKKAKHYWELAAMGGDESARHNLGVFECNAGYYDRALKHLMIAVEFGNSGSLKKIKQLYAIGYASKDDYAKALKAYQAYLEDIKSDQRDKAAAFDDDYKYY